MVNNNGIPIEVKKPFDTVYEIKDEYKVPSFEEFMESYESDGSLNYSDLNSWNIGMVESCGPGCKGYWPCGDSRCYGSNACLDNEKFFVLYTACPTKYCVMKGNKTKYHWVHDNSGCGNRGSSSRDKISDEARIRCPDCFNTSHMKHHKFKCSLHPTHEIQYRSTSSVSFMTVLATALESDLPKDAFDKITDNLRKDPWYGDDDY